jgi:uncharacterized protein YyaL (SSP411 family)
VRQAADALTDAVKKEMAGPDAGASGVPGLSVIAETVAYFKRAFDPRNGGVRRAPKFPSTSPSGCSCATTAAPATRPRSRWR